MSQVLTAATQDFIHIFNGYFTDFFKWGQWLFFALLTINLVILCLWYAFDRESFTDGVGQFIRKFFGITLFYTLMMHHSWLLQLAESTTSMGKTLTGAEVDPSSIVGTGIAIANNVWSTVKSFNPFTITSGVFLMIITYVVILFSFISIGLQLAVTMIITQLLIIISTFFLGFGAISATTQIARNTLDVILANCVKLLGIYMVVGAGSQVISKIENVINNNMNNIDMYWWLLSGVLLFWLLSKNLPEQLAKIVSGVVQETHGHSSAAIAMAAFQYAAIANRGISALTSKQARVSVNTPHHFSDTKTQGMGLTGNRRASGDIDTGSVEKPQTTSVSDHFKSIHAKTTEEKSVSLQPSSSGREAASPRNLRSEPSKRK